MPRETDKVYSAPNLRLEVFRDSPTLVCTDILPSCTSSEDKSLGQKDKETVGPMDPIVLTVTTEDGGDSDPTPRTPGSSGERKGGKETVDTRLSPSFPVRRDVLCSRYGTLTSDRRDAQDIT